MLLAFFFISRGKDTDFLLSNKIFIKDFKIFLEFS